MASSASHTDKLMSPISPPSSLLPTSLPIFLPTPISLTKSGSSWIIHIPKFCQPPKNRANFKEVWKQHPNEYHPLFLFGKRVYENRYSQMYATESSSGESTAYRYSGTSRACVVCDPKVPDEQFVLDLCKFSDQILEQLIEQKQMDAPDEHNRNNENGYNACLVNWYKPDHCIGLHADDESEMDNQFPILSLSWGGPRRFLLRPKKHTSDYVENVKEILLKDGDLLVMGGKCQQEFKHEVPKLRKKDGLVGDRISWTIRRMKDKKGAKRKAEQVDR
jgi:alkylated DNA repair dioxygenase AlkB